MEEIDLKELIGMFLEKKFLIIFVVILFAILGAVYTTHFITPMYESSTSLVLVQTGDTDTSLESITTTDITLNSKLVDAYAVVAKSKRVANKVLENLKLEMPIDDLRESITISSASDTQNLKVAVRHENPKEACKIANEVAEVFIEEVTEIYKVKNLYILDPAEVNTIPCNINLAKNIVIFAFVGAILVAGYILLVNMLDTTIKTDTDIEKAVAVPVLASIIFVDENNKKKVKNNTRKQSSSQKSTDSSFESSVQFYYENNVRSLQEDHEDNASLFSYVNKKDLEDAASLASSGRRKRNIKNIKKGGN